MERPWLILRRVLDVDIHLPGDDDDMLADADPEEQAAAVGEAEADAQAQEQQHAAVAQAQAEEDAQAQEEQYAAAVDAAAWAQDEQQAAVGEGNDELEALLLELEESVVNVNTNAAVSEFAHQAMGAGGPNFSPDFIVTVAPPPWVSSLITGPGAHPDPARPDMYPYIIATGPFCLLVHFAIAPSFGTNFQQQPNHSHLVVVQHFLRDEDDDGAQIAACAVHLPDRPIVNMPALRNIESIGLVCNQETGHFKVAELIVTTGAPEAVVVYLRTDTAVAWQGNSYPNPLLVQNRLRDWVPHGTVTIESTVFWFDLSWGIISCDLTQPRLEQMLNLHRLPPGRVLRAGAGALPNLHCERCIAVSENLVRYVEIILSPHQAATVNMWYRDMEGNPWRWVTNYKESFADIWDDESYAQTGLPRNPPMLAGVSPVNSRVVYFTLNQRLFGVNVPEHRVVHCEYYEPLDSPGQPDEPDTSRYLITWNLDDDGEINVGHHQPGEHSDHGDSSSSGPMDEGDNEMEANGWA